MINYIHCNNTNLAEADLSEKIIGLLNDSKRVLWLICGGSNIPVAIKVMNLIRQKIPTINLKNLTIMQTDERYGPIGHKDSNWQQMIDGNFNFNDLNSKSILKNLSLQETVKSYELEIVKAFTDNDIIIGLFGIGTDGHIAGILPETIIENEKDLVIGYQAKPFVRVSLSFSALLKFNYVYVLVFGQSKREAIDKFKKIDLSLKEQPMQILKKMKNVSMYSDQF